MANTFVNESFIDIYNTTDQSEIKETDSRTDNYDTLVRNSRNEMAVYQTLDLDKSKQEVANERKGLIWKNKAICAFRVILTVVVIAILIAVVISFTTTTKKAKVDGGWSSWEDWGSCSVSCGIGVTSRNRTCGDPVAQGSGVQCPGPSLENTLCFPGSCSKIGECATQPCLKGSCSDLVNGYSCSCFSGFSGIHCQTDINECVSNPCLHGTCTDLVNGYKCTCFVGYSGLYCESEWRLIFRATPGIGDDVYEAWTGGTSVTTDDVKCITTNVTSCNQHYRNPIVGSWTSIRMAKVKFAFYKNNIEVAYVIFNATGSDVTSWFRPSRITESSWSTIISDSFNYFSIEGHVPGRRFYINRNYGGCPYDTGYAVAVTSRGHHCTFDKQNSYPQFLYATSTTFGYPESMKGMDRADVMAIFIK